MPVSYITFMTENFQFPKSIVGAAKHGNVSREDSLCVYSYLETNKATHVVPDTLEDERFKANPFCVSGPQYRFYAAVNVFADGVKVANLCVLDYKPRYDFSEAKCQILLDLAASLGDLLTIRRTKCLERLIQAEALSALREDSLTDASEVASSISLMLRDLSNAISPEDEEHCLIGLEEYIAFVNCNICNLGSKLEDTVDSLKCSLLQQRSRYAFRSLGPAQ